MIDLNDFMECADWHCSRGLGWQDSKLTHNDVYAIITRLRGAERDAARYRWLKDANSNWTSPVMVAKGFRGNDGVDLIDDVDAYIDQAIKEKGDE